MLPGDEWQGIGLIGAALIGAMPAWLSTRKNRQLLKREFTPNGGSSTKDQLNRIETAQAVATVEAASAKEALHSVAVQVARVDVRLDEHINFHLGEQS